MNDFRSLKFLDYFQFIFAKLGVEYDVMRKILQLKLTMDKRRAPTIFNSAKKKEGNQFLKSLWMYGFYGLILIPFLFLGENYIFQMSLVFGIIMFILMTSMIADFSTVLLDVRDKNILGTKPVNKRTISAAKMVHVIIYMTLLTGAFVGIPFIVMIVGHGIAFSLVFLLLLVLNVLFVVALTALIYIVTLQFFSGEKLKDIINYVQILLSVAIFVGYQVLIRSFDMVDLNLTYDFSWWHVFIPPIWFGAPFELILHQNLSTIMIGLSLLAFLIPLVSIAIYYKLMPSFERNLQKLLEGTGKSNKKTGLNGFLSKLVCFNREERVFFQFATLMMKREREFKLKVYPSLGFAFIAPFIFLLNGLRDSSFSDLGNGKEYLFIYFSSIMIPTVIHMLKFSENYQGSWLFHATPIKDLAALKRGTLKAFIVKLYLPVLLLLSVCFIAIFSAQIIPDLLVVFLAGILHTIISDKLYNKGRYPFSESFSFAMDMNTATSILLLVLAGIFALIHFFASMFSFGIYVYLVVLLVATVVSWRNAY